MRGNYVSLYYVAAGLCALGGVGVLLSAFSMPAGMLRWGAIVQGAAGLILAGLLAGRASEAVAVFASEERTKTILDRLERLSAQISTGGRAEAPEPSSVAPLIACRVCGSQISKKVAKCPHCGTVQFPNA